MTIHRMLVVALVFALVLEAHATLSAFVAPHGADDKTCSRASPCRSVQAGIDAAVGQGISVVRVQSGVYNETVELSRLQGLSSLSILGGHSKSWSAPPASAPSTQRSYVFAQPSDDLRNSTTHAMLVQNVTAPVMVSDFVLVAINAVGCTDDVDARAGRSAYTAVVLHSERVTFHNVDFQLGRGSDGCDAQQEPDVPLISAPAGKPGTRATDCSNPKAPCHCPCTGPRYKNCFCCSTKRLSGGAGGSGEDGCNAGGAGGAGGQASKLCCSHNRNNCRRPTAGISGVSGHGFEDILPNPTQFSLYGRGGAVGRAGGNGHDGRHGAHGRGGVSAAPGGSALAGELEFWRVSDGSVGQPGEPGTGGGGGGGSGGYAKSLVALNFKEDYGASGGGGGSGGCGSLTLGGGGGGGGASFGVFVYSSRVSLIGRSSALAGRGGDGGRGGAGSFGQTGGDGGSGGRGWEKVKTAGQGGRGGDGGNSGAGGGGPGGSVFAVFAPDAASEVAVEFGHVTLLNSKPGHGGEGGEAPTPEGNGNIGLSGSAKVCEHPGSTGGCLQVNCRPGCMNGGVCVGINKCHCQPGWGGEVCDEGTDPEITELKPNHGALGSTLIVLGTRFRSDPPALCVFANADGWHASTPASVTSSTSLTCSTPETGPPESQAQDVHVYVRTGAVESDHDGVARYTFTTYPPELFDLHPKSGPLEGETDIVVTGEGLYQDSHGVQCLFSDDASSWNDAVSAPARVRDSGDAVCVSPPHAAGTCFLALKFDDTLVFSSTGDPLQFKYTAKHEMVPQITSLEPAQFAASHATTFVVHGTKFLQHASSGALACQVDGIMSLPAPEFLSDKAIRCTAPAPHAPGPVLVEVSNNGVDFSNTLSAKYVAPPPELLRVSPAQPYAEREVVVSAFGTDFVDTDALMCRLQTRPSGNFPELLITANWVSDEHLRCHLPAHEPAGMLLSVSNDRKTWSKDVGLSFMSANIVLDRAEPPAGKPGDLVTVTGATFVDVGADGMTCDWDDVSTPATFLGPTMVSCQAPARLPDASSSHDYTLTVRFGIMDSSSLTWTSNLPAPPPPKKPASHVLAVTLGVLAAVFLVVGLVYAYATKQIGTVVDSLTELKRRALQQSSEPRYSEIPDESSL